MWKSCLIGPETSCRSLCQSLHLKNACICSPLQCLLGLMKVRTIPRLMICGKLCLLMPYSRLRDRLHCKICLQEKHLIKCSHEHKMWKWITCWPNFQWLVMWKRKKNRRVCNLHKRTVKNISRDKIQPFHWCNKWKACKY